MEHPIIIDIIILLVGAYFGILSCVFYIKYSYKKEKKKYKENIESIFKEISTNISLKNADFLYRINNTVRFKTNLKKLGLIDVYFYLNRSEILLFKNEEALYSSKDLDEKILSELDYTLKVSFSTEIHDTVNVFGTIYSRKYFIDTFKVNIEDLGLYDYNDNDSELKSDEEEYDIDSILDKINLVGYEKLSLNEKNFLKKYSNG